MQIAQSKTLLKQNKKGSKFDEFIVPFLSAKKDTEVIHKLFSYPAKFQASLPQSIISNFTKEGDLVLDPFSGGGTTSAEAVRQGRNSFAMDLNPISVLVSRAKVQKLSNEQFIELYSVLKKMTRPISYKFVSSDEKVLLGKELADFAESVSEIVRKNKSKSFVYLLATSAIKRIKLATRRDKEHLRIASFQEHLDYIVNEVEKMHTCFSGLNARGKTSINRVEYGSNHDIPMKNSTVKIIITSPPYPGVDIEYNLIQLQRRDLNRCYRSDIAQRMSEIVINCPYSPTKRNLSRGGVETDDYWVNAEMSLLEMSRVLKKDGLCFLYIGFKENKHRLQYEKMIKSSGFSIEETYDVELGNERVASSRGTFHGRDTNMMKSDILYVLRK